MPDPSDHNPPTHAPRMRTLRGIPVSPGIAIGRVLILDSTRTHVPRRIVAPEVALLEQERVQAALDASQQELKELFEQAERDLGQEAAKVFAFHRGLLRDPALTKPMLDRVFNEHVTAEYAVQESFRALAEQFAAMPDSAFRTKVDDVWDLDHRVMRHLIGDQMDAVRGLDHPAIIAAPDLTPSRAASFPPENVLGFATDTGGQTSHTAIFARALGVAAVVGLERFSAIAQPGDQVIIDGDTGNVFINPDEPTLDHYREAKREAEVYAKSLEELRDEPAVTLDGVRVQLLGNIEFARECPTVLGSGGDGVGLFRTEFLWLTSDHEPTEEEQYEEYAAAVRGCEGRPVTLRTFDLGADKYTQERALNPERNPFLGCRSIRYSLQNLGMFKRQLRAVLRASAHGPIKIMFPLIATVMELRQAKMIVRDVMEDLAEEGIEFDPNVPIGMMVETPASVVMATAFAREVDFFSIGTNDLVQYALAVDRTNERVASLYSAADPAVLRLIKDVIRAARRREIDVSLCGEMGGEDAFTMLLLGLGLRTLSVTPARIPYLKRVVRSVDVSQCERLARTASSFESERQVTAYLREQARKIVPEAFGGRPADGVTF